MNKQMLYERLKRELNCTFQYPELDKIIKRSKVYSRRNKEYDYYDNKRKEVGTSFKYKFNEEEYQKIKISAVWYLEEQGKLTYRNNLAKEYGINPKVITDLALRRKIARIIIGNGRGKKMFFNKANTKEIREYLEKRFSPRKTKQTEQIEIQTIKDKSDKGIEISAEELVKLQDYKNRVLLEQNKELIRLNSETIRMNQELNSKCFELGKELTELKSKKKMTFKDKLKKIFFGV